MSLTVEDGTGKSDADSYLTEADSDTYHTAYGDPTSWSSSSTAQKEEALRLATQYLDARYYYRWLGTRANDTQALNWPRRNITDGDGYSVPSTSLPQSLKDACAIIAGKVRDDVSLLDDFFPGKKHATDESVGPIADKITYSGGVAQIKQFTLAYYRVRNIISASGSVVRG